MRRANVLRSVNDLTFLWPVSAWVCVILLSVISNIFAFPQRKRIYIENICWNNELSFYYKLWFYALCKCCKKVSPWYTWVFLNFLKGIAPNKLIFSFFFFFCYKLLSLTLCMKLKTKILLGRVFHTQPRPNCPPLVGDIWSLLKMHGLVEMNLYIVN